MAHQWELSHLENLNSTYSNIQLEQNSVGLLRGDCTLDQNVACFDLYLKITFLKNNIHPYSKLSKEIKNSIDI